MPNNRLSKEKSPYLLQHKDNPVMWYPWSDEAFAVARKEQKPILLSVGYSTCHWCHVMAHESFEDETIADFINANFIAIKVDREERPDIDHVYMAAVTSMTGQGGWPLTAFLTPKAEPFYGGTYFPPFAKWGSPGFLDLLHSISQAWRENREGIINSAAEITDVLKQRSSLVENTHPLNEGILRAGIEMMAKQFDPINGGFGSSPKFPMGHNLSFLLHCKDLDPRAQNIAEATLKAMARGGIWDHLGGGFHRYSTDERWHVPHFEKMLYDQALLVVAYAEAYQETGELQYANIIQSTLDYVLSLLTSPQGAFYCAEDADTEGEEGTFYVWEKGEIIAALGAEAAQRFAGSYEDHVLMRKVSHEDEAFLSDCRQKLFAIRLNRTRPHLDDKILTDWNGLMIWAFAFAGSVLGRQDYIDTASRSANFIISDLNVDGQLKHRWREGEVAINAMLDDYAFLILGLIQLHESTFEEKYLKEATLLVDQMIDLFLDQENGGFFMTSKDTPLIIRPQDVYDGALPSGNSVAALALLKLHHLTARGDLLKHAENLFLRFIVNVTQALHAHAFLLIALDLYLRPPMTISVKGHLSESNVALLRKVVYKHLIPRKIIKREDIHGALEMGVCKGNVCLPSTSDISTLSTIIK